MAKIMLVEDDNNLREIYEARLIAEGYEIVSAKDGEEALALAVKEKPDLIISDVMMPKISGFDMLDILRTTPETKNTKIIMMTALSQAEDKSRADRLGADRYLVKSQVTLEDVAAVAREVLTGETTTVAAIGTTAQATPITTVPGSNVTTVTDPVSVAMTTPAQDDPIATPTDNQQSAPVTPAVSSPTPVTTVNPATPRPDEEDTSTVKPAVELGGNISPELSQPSIEEEKAIDEQINQFIATAQSNEPSEGPEQETPQPAPAPDTSGSLPSNEPALEEITVATAPPDATATAADNAAKLADAVNDLLDKPNSQPETPVVETTAPATEALQPTPATLTESSPEASSITTTDTSGGKKVIQPINDLSNPGPDLNVLLEKEELKATTVEPMVITTQPTPEATTITITPDGEIQPPAPTPTTPETVPAPVTPPAEVTQTAPATAPATEAPQPTPASQPTPTPNDPSNIAL